MTDQLLNILPEVFRTAAQTNLPMQALAAAATEMHAPAHEVLSNLPGYFDPYRAPESMLPYLAQWVDLGWLVTGVAGVGSCAVRSDRLRDLVANAAELSARRGTASGMLRFLHLATGVPDLTIADVPGAFQFIIRVPATAADELPLVRRIIEGSKPAHTTCWIEIEAAAPEPDEHEQKETGP